MTIGFCNDQYINGEFYKLVQDHGIDTIVETGTYHGDTTMALYEMGKEIHTIEINQKYQAEAKKKLKDTDVNFHLGSSQKVLDELIPKLKGNLMFFLDAHWGAYNPLVDELKMIAKHKIKPVIVIHDFKVPGHPELGYDEYNGQAYEWSWIEAAVKSIYGADGFDYYYNEQAHPQAHHKRGVIYITPKA